MLTFMPLLMSGGPVVWILLTFSVVAITLSLYKIWQLWGHFRISQTFSNQALNHIKQHQRSQAMLLVKAHKNPRAVIVHRALKLFDESSLSLEQAKEEVVRIAQDQVARLNDYLRPLEVIATVAPLLGLFGTVLGMIEAFRAMEAAGSQIDPSILSGGIWQALLTTAVGLGVAIPVSLIHSTLERRIETETSAIHDHILQLFTLEAAHRHHKQHAGLRTA